MCGGDGGGREPEVGERWVDVEPSGMKDMQVEGLWKKDGDCQGKEGEDGGKGKVSKSVEGRE